jgi:hypothetical protein
MVAVGGLSAHCKGIRCFIVEKNYTVKCQPASIEHLTSHRYAYSDILVTITADYLANFLSASQNNHIKSLRTKQRPNDISELSSRYSQVCRFNGAIRDLRASVLPPYR